MRASLKIEISGAQISEFTKNVEQLLPESLLCFNWSKLVTGNHLPGILRPRCFVDSWPNFSLVFCSHFEPSATLEWNNINLFEANSEKTEEEILEFFQSVNSDLHFSSSKCRVFGFVNTKISSCMEKMLQSETSGQFIKLNAGNIVWWIPPTKLEHVLKIRVKIPEDLYADTVKLSEASHVDLLWPHRDPESELKWEDRIRYLPSKCFRKKSDNSMVCFGKRWQANHGVSG